MGTEHGFLSFGTRVDFTDTCNNIIPLINIAPPIGDATHSHSSFKF